VEESIAVSITYPLEGNSYSDNPAAIIIRATATDRYGEIVQVELLADVKLLGVSANEPYEMTWDDVPPGSYLLTARATNDADETLVSIPVQISVVSLPEIQSFTVDEGIVSFLLRGGINLRYRVDVSNDLASWDLLVETSMFSLPGLSGGAVVIVDAASADHPQRFYRASQIP
jgi:hypothetical protein